MVSFQQMGIIMSLDGVLWDDKGETVFLYQRLLRDYSRFGYRTVILTDRKCISKETVHAKLIGGGFEYGNIIFQLKESKISSHEFKSKAVQKLQENHFDVMAYFDSDSETIEAVQKLGITTNLVCLR